MDIYLDIDEVPGDVESLGYEGAVSIESFDFGVEGEMMPDTSGKEGSPSVLSCVTLTKKVDKASAALFNFSCSGGVINKATIGFLRPGESMEASVKGQSGIEYMNYILDDVIVSGYAISKKADESSLPIETIKLSFRVIHLKYTVYDKNGKRTELMRGGYDIYLGKELRS